LAELRISTKWMAAASGEPEVNATAALVDIHVDNLCLTRNQDVWAETVRDNVFVSAYPLAMWFATSWWRLNHEPLPAQQPGHDWRMVHELGAANHGFVWPRMVFIPDGESIDVWAGTSMTPDQSVQYLQALEVPKRIPMTSFQQSIQRLVQSVLARLDAKQIAGTDLANFWNLLQADLAEPEAAQRRKLEAQLGFDPEECPEHLLSAVLNWKEQVGDAALSELAPVISAARERPSLGFLDQLADFGGMIGAPEVSSVSISHQDQGAPWERAVHDARALRCEIGDISAPIPSQKLHELLGLSNESVANWSVPEGRLPVSVAIPTQSHQLKFIPRKRHPIARRFEFARFLGEYLSPSAGSGNWLVSSDLWTSHQKYQRAFAAEFLCPVDALTDLLKGDFSDSAIEEAAEIFEVSEQTVNSLLLNNGHIYQRGSRDLPYQMAA